MDASLGYHSLKLNEKLLYLTAFACQFGLVPEEDMFQQKITKSSKTYQIYVALQKTF